MDVRREKGGPVSYQEIGDRDQTSAVLCVHGVTRAGGDFLPLARALAQQGHRVICPDMVGRGESDWLDNPTEYTLARYARDVLELLASLGVTTVDWLGTSMGGLLGILVAAAHPKLVRCLIVNDVGPVLDPGGLARILSYLGKPFSFPDWESAERHHRELYAPFGPLEPEQWEELARSVLRKSADGQFHYAYDLAILHGAPTNSDELWAAWDALRCPTLLLRGARSDVLSAATADEMLKRHQDAMMMTEMPKRGHAPPLVSQEEIAEVAGFLRYFQNQMNVPV